MSSATSKELQIANDLLDRKAVDLDLAAKTIKVLYFKTVELQAFIDTVNALLPADGKPPKQCLHQMIAEPQTAPAELEALRDVYEQARGVLRYDGIDKQRAIRCRDLLIEAIEVVKTIDGGNWEPTPAEAPSDAVRAFRDYIAVHEAIKLGGQAMDDMALELARIALDFKQQAAPDKQRLDAPLTAMIEDDQYSLAALCASDPSPTNIAAEKACIDSAISAKQGTEL